MTSKGGWAKIGERQVLAARAIENGFPIEKPFETLEDVEKYLSGDKVTCLLCGKDYKGLHAHLKVHGYTAEAYKEKYRIPTSYGLIGREVFDKLSEALKRRYELGLIPAATPSTKPRRWRGSKSVKEIKNDVAKKARLAALRAARHEKRLLKTHCNKGHLLKEVGALHCNKCSYLWKQSQPGYLSRRELCELDMLVTCTDCGGPTVHKKYAGARKTALCVDCRKRKLKAAGDVHRAENPSYRREEYQKRKAKQALLKPEDRYIPPNRDSERRKQLYREKKAKLAAEKEEALKKDTN